MKINNNKGEIMNKFNKVGITALAGSLVAFSAQAVEMSVAGSAKITYQNGDTTEVTGNPMGMNTSLAFSGSGEVNGYDTSLTVVAADQLGGMSSAAITVDLGDMGKLSFDQGTGIGGLSTIDDKTPTAAEEIWDGLDAVTGTKDGKVGMGNAGAFVYSNSYSGINMTSQLAKGNSASSTDDAVSGGSGGTSLDIALTTDGAMLGLEGVAMGLGYGQIANGKMTGAGNDEHDEHSTVFLNYSMGMITAGAQYSKIDNGGLTSTDEVAEAWGISANVNDSLSISYGEREIEYDKYTNSADVREDIDGYAIAYTMGSAKITYQSNETKNNGGTKGVSDENTQIALSLSF
jgi:outer membrane protein OmpU